MEGRANGFRDVITDDASLGLFLKKMAEFDQAFCAAMIKGSDYTIRLEVRGNVGVILHTRVYTDDIEQPKGAQKRVDQKRGRAAVHP